MLPPHAGADLPTLGHQPGAAAGRGARPALRRRAGVRVPVRPGPPGRRGEPVLRAGDQRRGGRRPVPVHLAQAPRAWNGGCAARPRSEAIFLAERAEGLSAVAVGWAFAAAAEAAAGVTPPPAAASAPGQSRSSSSGCTTTPPPWRRCARPPACRSARPPPRSRWNGCCGSTPPRSATGTCSASSSPAASAARPTRRCSAASCPAPTASCAAPPTRCWARTPSSTGWRPPAILTAEQARRLGLVGPVARATGLATDARLAPAAAAPYAGTSR